MENKTLEITEIPELVRKVEYELVSEPIQYKNPCSKADEFFANLKPKGIGVYAKPVSVVKNENENIEEYTYEKSFTADEIAKLSIADARPDLPMDDEIPRISFTYRYDPTSDEIESVIIRLFGENRSRYVEMNANVITNSAVYHGKKDIERSWYEFDKTPNYFQVHYDDEILYSWDKNDKKPILHREGRDVRGIVVGFMLYRLRAEDFPDEEFDEDEEYEDYDEEDKRFIVYHIGFIYRERVSDYIMSFKKS